MVKGAFPRVLFPAYGPCIARHSNSEGHSRELFLTESEQHPAMAAGRRAPDVDDEELALLLGQYALGELTLGQAAERVGVSRLQMRGILQDAGVELRTGPEDEEAARDEVDTALDFA